MSNELDLTDVCKFKGIDKLKGETRDKMLKAPSLLQKKVGDALSESFNPNLCKVARLLQVDGFSSSQAVEVIYAIDGHRDPIGDEIERAVSLVYNSSEAPAKRSEWSVFEANKADVIENLKQRNIKPLSEEEFTAKLGDAPEIDNVSDFLAEFFKGVEQPIYIGNRFHGIIEHVDNWLMMPEIIEESVYDQVLANPMKRKLTAEERSETVTDASGKKKLKYASGGRCKEFASDTLDVVTFECDTLPLDLQLGIIHFLSRHLPLVAVLSSANKSYHATFSAKGVPQINALRRTLVDLGCDGSVLNPYHLTRLGAVNRSDKGNGFQHVVWINGDARHESVNSQKLKELLPDISHEEIHVESPQIDIHNTFYMNGRYYILEATGSRYISVAGEDLTRQLRLAGYSAKGAEGEMSAVDKFKAYVVSHNTVDAAGALAGRSIGLTGDPRKGLRYLVTRKNTRTQAKEGNWDNLRKLLEAQYGEEQLKYLYSWLNRSRYQLEREQTMHGHVLVISGSPNGGKSLVVQGAIRPLLGDMADAHAYMCKDNQFNGDLIGSEMLLVDDKDLSRKMEDRRSLGSQIKNLSVTTEGTRCHRKGQDAFTVNPLWRVVMAINDTEKDLGALPPMGEGDEDTVGDKVLLLKCYVTELPFNGDKDQFFKLRDYIADDLEAFAYFIDNYEVPEEIKVDKSDLRFGFNRFHHPDLLAILNQNSNERTLLSATDMALFNDEYRMDVLTNAGTGRRYWQGSALDWSQALLSSKAIPHRVKNTVEGELAFGDSNRKAGKKIAAVAGISDGRFVRSRNNKGIIWTIHEPVFAQYDCEDDPF